MSREQEGVQGQVLVLNASSLIAYSIVYFVSFAEKMNPLGEIAQTPQFGKTMRSVKIRQFSCIRYAKSEG